MLCYVTKQGPPQIRRLGDDNVGNFQVAAVQRQRKTYCSIIEQYYTDVETWGELLLLGSPSTCGFSRYAVGDIRGITLVNKDDIESNENQMQTEL